MLAINYWVKRFIGMLFVQVVLKKNVIKNLLKTHWRQWDREKILNYIIKNI